MLGRANASMQMLFKGFWPPGAIVGGLIAQRYGVRFTLTLAALGIFASSLWLMFPPVRGLKDMPTNCSAGLPPGLRKTCGFALRVSAKSRKSPPKAGVAMRYLRALSGSTHLT